LTAPPIQPYVQEQLKLAITRRGESYGHAKYASPNRPPRWSIFTGDLAVTNFDTTDDVCSRTSPSGFDVTVDGIHLDMQPDKLQGIRSKFIG